MTQHRDLNNGDIFPASLLDALQEHVGSYVSPNFRLNASGTTAVTTPAGTGNDQVTMAIGGAWRRITAPVTSPAISGAAGTFSVYATASANSFSNTPVADTDNTVYAWALEVRASGTPSTALYRKVGEVEWDGTKITMIRSFFTISRLEYIPYTLPGPLTAPTGGVTAAPTDGTYLMPFKHRQRSTEMCRLIGVNTQLGAGTVNVSIYRKPASSAEAAIVTNQAVTTTDNESALSIPLADGDKLRPALSSLATSPANLTAELVIERTSAVGW